MKKTYQGSCHCGAVVFACETDLAAGTVRCNCSFCSKARFWMILVKEADVRIVQGEDALTDYRHTPAHMPEPFLHLTFCRHCGVRPFSRGGSLPMMGSAFFAVNVACLDATDEELASAPVDYPDGRNNAWEKPAPYHYL